MAKSLEILPPSPGSGLSRCKWAKTAQLWKFQKNHRQMSLFSALSPNTCTAFPLTACSLNPITDHRRTERTERCEGTRWGQWEHGIPQDTWTLLHSTQVPSPGSQAPCLLISGKAPAAGWTHRCSEWSLPTQHQPLGSRLFQRCVIFDILPSFQGLSSPPASTLNDHVLCAFSHTAPSSPSLSHLQTRDYGPLMSVGNTRMRNVASIKDTEWPFSTCEIASIAIETEHCS